MIINNLRVLNEERDVRNRKNKDTLIDGFNFILIHSKQNPLVELTKILGKPDLATQQPKVLTQYQIIIHSNLDLVRQSNK